MTIVKELGEYQDRQANKVDGQYQEHLQFNQKKRRHIKGQIQTSSRNHSKEWA